MTLFHRRASLLLAAAVFAALSSAAQSPLTDPVIRTGFHLTARPWHPLRIPRNKYLEVIEGECRYSILHQDASGAIIDPFLHREHQYATPYFAHAVGTLIAAGRARDLLPYGIKAMEHSTANFGGGKDTIPDQHGEFFIAALTEALELYTPFIPAAQRDLWRDRLRKPVKEVIRGGTNNWETYPMKGEWLRQAAGLATRQGAIDFIEGAWHDRQHARFAPPPWSLYHDRSSDPDTLSVEAVGRGNLLALIALGYDGPSAAEIRELVEDGSRTTLDLQDASGQVPANGRTDDHVWVEIGYQLLFETMAERMHAAGDDAMAGEYRHAAMLSFQSAQRWRRSDGKWAGSFFVTKNHFDPALRVGYQEASQYSNYNGSLMFHLAEAYHTRKTAIEERPAPTEIGGYTLATDKEFSTAFANAGGMQIQVNLRGQEAASSGNRWTPLGLVRFARPGWETRLGPSDGALAEVRGVSFAPEFEEAGHWLRMADLSSRYEGAWSVTFVHPLLVRCAVEYHPRAGQQGPSFREEFIVTPDGVLSTTRRLSGEGSWGVTWPLLENDGAPLVIGKAAGIRKVGYPAGGDQQTFIAARDTQFADDTAVRGSYGDLRPVRALAAKEQVTFVYPRNASDPTAEVVRDSLRTGPEGFQTVLGRVAGTIYVGRTSAGGYGSRIELKSGVDVSFDKPCAFLLQLQAGRVAAAEADADVSMTIQGRKYALHAHVPLTLATLAAK